MADATVFLTQSYDQAGHINVGVGEDLTILELARLVAEVVGYPGQILTDPSKPDGTPRKLMDVSRLCALGWNAKVKLRDGVADTYRWYVNNAVS